MGMEAERELSTSFVSRRHPVPPVLSLSLSLKNRLLAVALLGVFSCAVALFGLGRILQHTTAMRVERAREAVTEELGLLRQAGARARGHGAPSEPPPVISVLGMRGNYVASPEAFDMPRTDLGLDEATSRALASVSRLALQSRNLEVTEVAGPEPLLVMVGAAPTESGSIAWIAYKSHPFKLLTAWRLISASLTLATLLLVGMAVSTVVLVKRGAATLNASLAALAGDLEAPVPRPPVPELADLADHIAGLARALARAQEEQDRLGAELAQRDRLAALGRVVAGVAHEVRNPLASIKLRVDLGRLRSDTPPQLAKELLSVSDEVTRLDRLVAELLVVAGRRSGPRAATALGSLVEQRVGLLLPWATERKVRIEVSGAASAALDGDAVARAVDNLVRNAVEASPPEGAVEVRVLDDDRAARVQVCDRGAGVDDARVHELFEPFFTTKPEGTGLGLALSRAIAAAHGGTLTYARDDGVTCFELTFPRAGRPSGARFEVGPGGRPAPAASAGVAATAGDHAGASAGSRVGVT